MYEKHSDIPWYILGTGAIGTLFGAKLLEQAIPCCFLFRSARNRPPQTQLSITNLEKSEQSFKIHSSAIHSDAPIQRLLVCTKSYQTLAAIASIAGRLTDNAHIVLLQNGMGQQQLVADNFPLQNIIGASTTQGALLNSPLNVKHTGDGATVFGALDSTATIAPDVIDALSSIGMQLVPDINLLLWNKLKINAVINPLTALNNCPNGDIVSNQKLRLQATLLSAEIDALDQALAHNSSIHNPTIDKVLAVATATATNRSSMLQDIQHRRQSEIAFINQYLQQQADKLQIETPINQKIIHDIQKLELSFREQNNE